MSLPRPCTRDSFEIAYRTYVNLLGLCDSLEGLNLDLVRSDRCLEMPRRLPAYSQAYSLKLVV